MPWPPTVPGTNVPLSVERVIAVRWGWWVPWVLMEQRRARDYNSSVAAAEMDRPRQLAMYIARQLTGASLEEIGREFGNRHHTTVLHSINRIEVMRCSDEALNRTITRLVGAVVART